MQEPGSAIAADLPNVINSWPAVLKRGRRSGAFPAEAVTLRFERFATYGVCAGTPPVADRKKYGSQKSQSASLRREPSWIGRSRARYLSTLDHHPAVVKISASAPLSDRHWDCPYARSASSNPPLCETRRGLQFGGYTPEKGGDRGTTVAGTLPHPDG